MAEAPLDIYWVARPGRGWRPVAELAELAARHLGGRLIVVSFDGAGFLKRVRIGLAPQRGRAAGRALLIASEPSDLLRLYGGDKPVPRYDMMAAWIIDAFQTDVIPNRQITSRFDLIAQATAHDLDHYAKRFGDRARHLPIGADVWGRGGHEGARGVDLLRFGRQPEAWRDDEISAAAAAAAGVRFQGRPDYVEDPAEERRIVDAALRQAKYVLASSNLVAPHVGTHPTKEYITLRWMTSLAQGATMFGVQPLTDPAMSNLLWPEATVHVETADLAENLAAVKALAADWRPELAKLNHLRALERLDWRWRFKTLAEWLELKTPALDAELAEISARISAETD